MQPDRTLTVHASQGLDSFTTDATQSDYTSALLDAIATILRSNDQDATICVPDFVRAGHPWTLLHTTDPGEASRWCAVREPSDDPGRSIDAAAVIAFDHNIDAAAAQMLAHDQAHPFVINWAKPRAATARYYPVPIELQKAA